MRQIWQQGISLIEVFVGLTIVSLVLVFVGNSVELFTATSKYIVRSTQAIYLAEEGQELLRFIRDENWNTLDGLTNSNTYYLTVSTTTIGYSAVSTETFPAIPGLQRRFVLDEVRRDANDDLLPLTSGSGTVDPDMRQVETTVLWNGESVSFTSLLSNIHDI